MSQNLPEAIEKFVGRLRRSIQLDLQHNWTEITESDGEKSSPISNQSEPAIPNEQGYLVFPAGLEVRWFRQTIRLPNALQGYPLENLSLRLVLTWWAEDAQLFVNGELKQQGDLFDSSARVLITEQARPGDEYQLALRLVSPGHDIGALMRSHLLYEKNNSPVDIDPGLVADEVEILAKYLSAFEPEQLESLTVQITKFDWGNLADRALFDQDLSQLRQDLLPLAQQIKQRCFHLLGHAHLDMAWLWTTAETYEVAERTFRSVLNLQQDFPQLTFGHTSPALYEWLGQHRPQLLAEIKQAFQQNHWEILGGMWIEPETNLVSGESLIRQFIYGQEYYLKEFGEISKIAWLPDSFGFTWQLPQIMEQCGIEYFVTGKLHWNDATKFPHGCFWWEAPNGTRLLTLMSPPNVTGVMDTNPLTMTNYAVEWEQQTQLQDIFWLPGVGDHGGGPTRDMLEVAQKWQQSPFFPQLQFSTAQDYLQKIDSQAESTLPVWCDELYLELHRGCYTVHADQKQYNRRCERLLYEAEIWSTLASLIPEVIGVEPASISLAENWSDKIETAWKKVLFNQFHDILPGTSIPEVFEEANRDWQGAISLGKEVLNSALKVFADSVDLSNPPVPEAQPLLVFNSLTWSRSQVVQLEVPKLSEGQVRVWDAQGREVPGAAKLGLLSFEARDVPGIGYSLFWWVSQQDITPDFPPQADRYQLENEYLRVTVDPTTGELNSIFDLVGQREILSASGNELQFFADQGQYWDAWNIAPDYEQQRLSAPDLIDLEWVKLGLHWGIRVIRKFNQSIFRQDYLLEGKLLRIITEVDWQETQVMVKAAFPLDLASDRFTHEIPCGFIERPTQPQTTAEQAKWEVAALNWADLTDAQQNYGVSLLNDCKYGYDVQPSQLRLTLLRAPTWPDPQSDRGKHNFTYSIYPHQGDWRTAKTVQKGYELNTPLQMLAPQAARKHHLLPSQNKLLSLQGSNLILMALKPSDSQSLILRCYETEGKSGVIQLQGNWNWQWCEQLDCLDKPQFLQDGLSRIDSHQILTQKINLVMAN